jgi:hypothetical protein
VCQYFLRTSPNTPVVLSLIAIVALFFLGGQISTILSAVGNSV